MQIYQGCHLINSVNSHFKIANNVLFQIGWRVFRHDIITPRSWKLRVLNIVYPLLIILLLLYTYMYEIFACEWKLNIEKDTLVSNVNSAQPTLPTLVSLSLSPYYCLLRHSLLCFLTVFLHNFCPVHFFISVTVCLCSCVHVSVCSLVCVCVCGVVWRVVCVCVCFIMYSSHYRPHT